MIPFENSNQKVDTCILDVASAIEVMIVEKTEELGNASNIGKASDETE